MQPKVPSQQNNLNSLNETTNQLINQMQPKLTQQSLNHTNQNLLINNNQENSTENSTKTNLILLINNQENLENLPSLIINTQISDNLNQLMDSVFQIIEQKKITNS